jgi:hypothetical protein
MLKQKEKDNQTIEAFSASRELLAQAKVRAAQLSMSKSGYFRYAIAKEIGYSEAEARDMSLHGAALLLRRQFAGVKPASQNSRHR